MKTLFTLFLLAIGFSAEAANNFFCIKQPDYAGFQSAGNIRDVSVNVTPRGLYAQVELTFTMATSANASYSSSTNYEAILYFDLPEGSYIHESLLWLNDSTIINADIIERNTATSIYLGIVKRKSDPSLLVKNHGCGYRLNVYPLKTDYPRKVKITYTTPLIWKQDRACMLLPVGLLGASDVAPAISLNVNTNTVLTGASFIGAPFAAYITGQTAATISLRIPGNAYRSSGVRLNDLQLAYTSNNAANALLYIYPTQGDEGVYQFMKPASQIAAPRNIVFMLDHYATGGSYQNYMARSFAEVTRALRSAMHRELGPQDSFNVVYMSGSTAVTASSSWVVADSAGISTVMNSMPSGGSSYTSTTMDALLRTGLMLAKQRSGARAVLIGSDPHYNSAIAGDTLFNRLKVFLGGSFSNRIDIINNSGDNYSAVPGSEYLYTKLAGATGGLLYESKGFLRENYPFNISYDLNLDEYLRQICQSNAKQTKAYIADLPLSGITWSEYEPLHPGSFNPTVPYVQTGRYYGTWSAGANIEMNYMENSSLQTSVAPVAGLWPGSVSTYKSWLFNYMNDLMLSNAAGNRTVLLDSSIKNRVLHDYTAFLALETGDTIRMNTVNNGGGVWLGSVPQVAGSDAVRVWPNPFTESVSISSETVISKIRVSDILGRLVWEASPASTTATWSGKGMDGKPVIAGIYLIRLIDVNGREFVVKLQKGS